MKKNLYFYASGIHNPETLSGGDRIFIELAKRWLKKDKITIITSIEGKKLCQKYNLNTKYISIGKKYKQESSFFLFLKRLLSGIKFSLNYKLSENSIIYSTSNFISDSFPCFLLKTLNNKITWIAGYYLEPPNPFYGYDESKSKFRLPSFSNLSFYIQDKMSKFLIKHFADIIYITSEPDADKFPKHKKQEKTVIIKGGVDFKLSNKLKNKTKPYFDAVFIGRFHQQKGVLELIDIWEEVIKKKPNAKLAMIGNGPLENKVKQKINLKNMEKNIILFGFKDGLDKIKIFKNSKTVLHPALYDSGGMAAAEAMACKLPGISYDLEALKTYYPKGLLKTEKGNEQKFAENIIFLLKNKKTYLKLREEAYELGKEWDWNKRGEQIYNQTFKK